MFIFTAPVYAQAKPIISYYCLKKVQEFHPFCLFYNETVFLLITGTEPAACAASLSYFFAKYPSGSSDYLLHIGTGIPINDACVTSSSYFAAKITDFITKKSYYPDLLFRHSWEEASILTKPKEQLAVFDDLSQIPYPPIIAEYQSAYIFQSASFFLQPHQMGFYIIMPVSNSFDENFSSIFEYQNQISQFFVPFCFDFTEEEETLIAIYKEALHLTCAMEQSFRQCLKYYNLTYGSCLPLLHEFRKRIPPEGIQSKKEGKILFEQFKQQCIQS